MKRVVTIFLAMVCSLSAVVAQNDLQPLATVKLNGTESITLRQLKDRVETYSKQTGVADFTVDQKKEILDAMIDEKLVLQAAAQAKITVTDAMVDQMFLQSISEQVGAQITEQQFEAIVREQSGMSLDAYFESQVGMTLAEYKAYFKSQLTAQQYVLALKQNELNALATVSDAEIRSFYEINKASFVQNDILKLFLVIVPKGSDSATAKTLAASLHADLKSNKTNYNALRAQMQTDRNFQAGDIYVSKGTAAAQQLGMDYNTLLELFTRNVGFFDDVRETATDYQFYVIQEKYDAKMLSLVDVVQPDTTVTLYEYIRSQLSQQKQASAFASIVADVTSSLRVPENYQMIRTGSALDALLNW
ncbi:MAG: SurA N-terminal domain-containing protein [Spirochaetales bacterium]